MFIEKVAIFVIFLGPLIFFHELGHYFFARLFGVRVEVFSIGFGPKILKFKKGDTQYALSLIPLGGYVKMFGDDPFNRDEIPFDERRHSFTHKGKWARFWIVLGGPLANFILAYWLFYALLLSGEKVPEFRVGQVPVESPIHQAGFRPGDLIKKVNETSILNPADVAWGDKEVNTFTVLRNEKIVQVSTDFKGTQFFEELVKYPPILRKPLFVDKFGAEYLLSAQPKNVSGVKSLEQLVFAGDYHTLYLNQRVDEVSMSSSITFNPEKPDQFYQQLIDKGFRAKGLKISKVQPNSPADQAGLREGHVITHLNDKPIKDFYHLGDELQRIKTKDVEVGYWDNGQEKRVKIRPQIKNHNGQERKLIGVFNSTEYIPTRFVETPSAGVFKSFGLAFTRTLESCLKTLDGFKKLIVGEISFKTIGGPVTIGKVASDSFNTSISYFFQLMALISVHLGIINLFPIPVLDGGHILFIFFEIINRGPMSRRKMEIAQQVGLSFLLLLMFGALFNDFNRFF